jgi:hypothetical protein
VAASSCVPGLFEPISFVGLYEGRTVELVDGGVHDNQGTSALLSQDCDLLLVSDASGQTSTLSEPRDNVLAVSLRANDILMKRVRAAQYGQLDERQASGQLRGLMFIHLRADLNSDPVNWARCQDPFDASDDARPPERRGPVAEYGLYKDVQDRLSAVRTDLDSFSKAEAYALMTSGYHMATHALRGKVGRLNPDTEAPHAWHFLSIEAPMTSAEGEEEKPHARLLRLLEVARERAFKIWRLVTPLKVTAYVLGALALAAFLYLSLGSTYGDITLLDLRGVGGFVLGLLIATVLGKAAAEIWDYRATFWKTLVGLGLTVVGWIAAWVHILVFDSWFLKRGEKA